MCDDKLDWYGEKLEEGAALPKLLTMTVWRGRVSASAAGAAAGMRLGGNETGAGATLPTAGSAASRSGGRSCPVRRRAAVRGTAGSVHSGEPAPDGAEADEYPDGIWPAKGSLVVMPAGMPGVLLLAWDGSRTIGGGIADAVCASGANADRLMETAGGAAAVVTG